MTRHVRLGIAGASLIVAMSMGGVQRVGAQVPAAAAAAAKASP